MTDYQMLFLDFIRDFAAFFSFPMPGGFESSPTAHTSAAFPCQVAILSLHLARFPGYSVRSGHESSTTAYAFSFFLHQVAIKAVPPRTVLPIAEARNPAPPRTLSRLFCAQWHRKRSLLA